MDKKRLHTLLNLKVNTDSPNFIIYSEEISQRLDYVAHFIFNHVLKVNFSITNNISEFQSSRFFKINYSIKSIPNSFQIIPHALLFESGISISKPESFLKNNLIYFFKNKTSNNSLEFNYDIFSSVFYFISRYEELQTFTADSHGRFEAKASILFENKMYLKPVVDYWILEFKKELQNFYPEIKFPENKFKAISTIDVDNLYAYKAKGYLRTTGAIFKDILKFDFTNLKHRIKVLSNKSQDPFDIYTSNSEFCLDNNIPLIYFFLFKSGTKYDRTVNPNSNSFNKVFKLIKEKQANIGIHPSYFSCQDNDILKQEVNDFSNKLGEPVQLSRQHYLRFDIKTTPKLLLDNGIIADFTMGFASDIGFRAGTSFPFYYYDFAAEKQMDLLLVPFCAMDGAYFIYDKVSPEVMLNSLLDLANEVKKVNGFFITVFHERTFSSHLYPGYDHVYKKLFQKLNAI
ncbi:MAG: polysaccharide deacetylase family protein [Bacteroidota bacterium]|nr:polysaccharide deacetylase family protein [Bacteroidota bacterium]